MIEVSISEHAINRYGHDTLRGKGILDTLRQAGIPVVGDVFVLAGITHGKLTYWNETDLDGTAHMYTWREDENDRKEGKPLRVTMKGGFARKYGRHAVVPEDDEL